MVYYTFFGKKVGKLRSLIKARYCLFYCHCSDLFVISPHYRRVDGGLGFDYGVWM
jgi:hypothetical protein